MTTGMVARNYAAALFELARRTEEGEAYAAAFRELDEALGADPRIRRFLETPKVQTKAKQDALREALEGRVPDRFLRFLLVVVAKRRQALLPAIRTEFELLLDAAAGRINAGVTLARETDAETVELIAVRLSDLLGKRVVPHVHVNPELLGGFVAKFGDRVIDGSLRRQLVTLRREMLHATLPASPAA